MLTLFAVFRIYGTYSLPVLVIAILQELRNRALRIILVWSLFYLIPVYEDLHYLKAFLEN